MGLLVLVCGALCYAGFLAAFTYLVGFVGDFAVPRTVSSGPLVPAGTALAVDLALLAAFGLQHSLMARQGFKRGWIRLVPPALERSVYVLASSLALALLFWGWRPLPAPVWNLTAPGARWAMEGVFWLGWVMVLVSTFHLSHGGLFGLSQAWRRFRGQPERELSFRTPGLYRLVRHPLMLGFLLAFWATPSMDAGHLLLASGMTLYILVGTHFEEKDLRRTLGPDYEAYRREVPMLLPLPRRRK